MAPPPPASLPLGQRLVALAQTLQFAWFAGHVTLLLCALRFGISYITFRPMGTWAQFSYRTAFIAAAATYGIVVFKAYRARARSGKPQQSPVALLADENVQYLGMAFVWLFSRQIALALLPFTVYSVFHVATYTRSNLLPTLQPQPQGAAGAQAGGLSDTIGRFVKDYYDSSMTLVAMLEIWLVLRLVGSAILFTKGSWVLLTIYLIFFRVRHSQSSFMQNAVNQLTARADAQFANQSMPPAMRNVWEQVKGAVRTAADATDVNRFIKQTPAAAPKKAQ